MNIEKIKVFLNAIRYVLIIVIIGITSWGMYDMFSAQAPNTASQYHQKIEALNYKYARGKISQANYDKEYNKLIKERDKQMSEPQQTWKQKLKKKMF
jgi:Predicted membrane protein (DUF2078).